MFISVFRSDTHRFWPIHNQGISTICGQNRQKTAPLCSVEQLPGAPRGSQGAPGAPGPAAVTLQLGFILCRPGLDGLEPPRGSRGSRGGGLGGKRPGDLGHGSSLVKSLLGKYNI